MINQLKNTIVLAVVFGFATPALSQSFDDGSFGDGSFEGSSDSNVPPPPPNSVGGFDDSSFEPGNDSTTTVVIPPPPPVPENDSQVSDLGPVPPPPPKDETIPDAKPPVQGLVDPQITAFEMRDFGVPPQNTLRQNQFHGPTPTSIPGAQLVTTQVLVENMQAGVQILLIDVLGADYSLPGAYSANALASPGSFNDRTQQQASSWLQQITNGSRDVPIVIFCSDPMCWLSYNATLRTAAAGYSNVYWYRGGLRAWEMAGLQMQPTGF